MLDATTARLRAGMPLRLAGHKQRTCESSCLILVTTVQSTCNSELLPTLFDPALGCRLLALLGLGALHRLDGTSGGLVSFLLLAGIKANIELSPRYRHLRCTRFFVG